MKTKVAIHWFRRDLRLTDNTALHHAVETGFPVLPIFIFDKNILDALENRKDARVGFIHQTLENMHNALQQHGSGIRFFYSTPMDAWKSLKENYDIQGVFFNRDYEPYARERDGALFEMFQQENIPMHTFKDHVIFEKKEVCKDDGKPYTVFTPYSRKWKSLLKPEMLKPLPQLNFNAFYKMESSAIIPLEKMNFEKSDQIPFDLVAFH